MIATNGSQGAPSRERIDTNVLVYAVDRSSGLKHRIASDLLDDLVARDVLTVSAQVLNEFYSVVTRKKGLMLHEDAVRYIRATAAASVVLPLTLSGTLLALEAVARHGFSFWDALIWSAAREGGISTLYTEDFQHGREIEGVRIVAPFALAS